MARLISLRLPDNLARRMDREGRRRGLRRSALIRSALEAYLEGATLTSSKPYDRVRDLIGSLSGGPPDLGARHREYLREIIRDRR